MVLWDLLYGTDNLTVPRDLSTPSADELVGRCRDLVQERALETIIVAGADLSGVLRGKSVAADRFAEDPLAPVGLSDLALVLDVRGEGYYSVPSISRAGGRAARRRATRTW